jgi:hypothetical protein
MNAIPLKKLYATAARKRNPFDHKFNLLWFCVAKIVHEEILLFGNYASSK